MVTKTTKSIEPLADEWLNRTKGDCAMYESERACFIAFLNHVRKIFEGSHD